ncbi:MAG: hypothetical protein ACRD0K_29115 [Egibacteraceae bacterium]
MAPLTVEVVIKGRVRDNGRTLAEWVPDVVDAIVARFSPRRVLWVGGER